MKSHDEIKKGVPLYTPEEIKEILQQKGTIHSHEKLYRSALAFIQQLESQNDALSENIMWMEAERDDLKRTIRQLQVERDAEVGRLKQIRDCERCKNYPVPMQNIPCLTCTQSNNSFEWRGVQKEETP